MPSSATPTHTSNLEPEPNLEPEMIEDPSEPSEPSKPSKPGEPDEAPDLSRRTLRYADIISPLDLQTPITVVGCGAIGSWTAFLAAQMGFTTFHLIDPDHVSPENLGPQCFLPSDLYKNKVFALRDRILTTNPSARICPIPFPFSSLPPTPNAILIITPDNMACRSLAFTAFRDSDYSLLLDARMSAEFFHLFHVNTSPLALTNYPTTFFPDAEAEPLPCSARATTYCATLAASLILSSITNHLRSIPTPLHTAFQIITRDCFSLSNPSSIGKSTAPLSSHPVP